MELPDLRKNEILAEKSLDIEHVFVYYVSMALPYSVGGCPFIEVL